MAYRSANCALAEHLYPLQCNLYSPRIQYDSEKMNKGRRRY